MTKIIVILLIALVFEAVGVVFLSAGLKEIGEARSLQTSELARLARRGVTNPKILLGVLLETIFFVFLLVLLRRNDVSLIWPLTSLGFVLTRSEEHTSELQSRGLISYAVFCLKKKT